MSLPADLTRVSRRSRCPVCGGPDWCVLEGDPQDPTTVYCCRTEAPRRAGQLGWAHELRPDATTPIRRQTALFSATMPPDVRKLAADLLHDPVSVEAESGDLRVDRINHSVIYVDQADKFDLLPRIIRDRGMTRVLVFTRTKHRARKVAKLLARDDLAADSIHGDKSQSARLRALSDFKSGRIQVLVATDVASRGIASAAPLL